MAIETVGLKLSAPTNKATMLFLTGVTSTLLGRTACDIDSTHSIYMLVHSQASQLRRMGTFNRSAGRQHPLLLTLQSTH